MGKNLVNHITIDQIFVAGASAPIALFDPNAINVAGASAPNLIDACAK